MSIQYIMLVLMGFLSATLIALLLAPAFWKRAVRLTNERIRRALPMTEGEIRAEKDQLRARYAIRVSQLEKSVEDASLGAARQKIELNRRDASIASLETQITRLTGDLEEHQNARNVLEQTVADRIPTIEAKLAEARKLLVLRDREINDLSTNTRRQQDAIAEAKAINQRQAADIERLKSQVLAYEAQNRRAGRDPDVEGELALRAELDTLRNRVRDQAEHIDQLNAELSSTRTNAHEPQMTAERAATPQSEPTDNDRLITQLNRELAAAKAALRDAQLSTQPAPALVDDAAAADQIRILTSRVDDQAAEIERLKAELLSATTAGEGTSRGMPSLRDNRVALKARVSGLETKLEQRTKTVERLRAELAAANERAARQATHYMAELRRLGVGAHASASRSSRPVESARVLSVSSRTRAIFQAADDSARAGTATAADAQTLSRRMGAAMGADSASSGDTPEPAGKRVGNLLAALKGGEASKAAGTGPAEDAAAADAGTVQSTDDSRDASTARASPRRLVDRLRGGRKS